MSDEDVKKVLNNIDQERLLALEVNSLRIPSLTFEEGEYADFLAEYMADMGLEVEMMAVPNPKEPDVVSRQPVGRLPGTGGGASVMLNGHMDTSIEMSGWTVDPYSGHLEDGWVWGLGAHDDKGGIAAMISGVEGIVQSGLKPRGDILICPVIAHKEGGIGTRALLDAGIRSDMCINLEHSANTIANVCVGLMLVRVTTSSPELFFRYTEEARNAYWNPIEQQAEVMRRLGASMDPVPEGGWMKFAPHSELPGFPKVCLDTINKNHYFHERLSDLSTRECEMTFQIRLVPGQTVESVKADIAQLLEGIKRDHPAFNYTLEAPASGVGDPLCQLAMETPADHPLVKELAAGFELATGRSAQVGGYGRLGNIGDGNIMAEAGIPSVQFGPGDIRLYKEWPTPDERVLVSDLMDAARAIGVATWNLTK